MQIEWTQHGLNALDFIMTCSRDYYGDQVLKKLRLDIRKSIPLLSSNPLMGKIEQCLDGLEVEYRSLVMSKKFKLIYFVFEEKLFITDIWDVRQSPENLRARYY